MPYTTQEAFDIQLNALRKQRVQSMRYSEPHGRLVCAYRGDNGTRCAVGHLLPDDEYQERFDLGVLNARYLDAPSLAGLSNDFLIALQHAHDSAMPPATPHDEPVEWWMSEWEKRMADIAESFHLTYTPPVEVVA